MQQVRPLLVLPAHRGHRLHQRGVCVRVFVCVFQCLQQTNSNAQDFLFCFSFYIPPSNDWQLRIRADYYPALLLLFPTADMLRLLISKTEAWLSLLFWLQITGPQDTLIHLIETENWHQVRGSAWKGSSSQMEPKVCGKSKWLLCDVQDCLCIFRLSVYTHRPLVALSFTSSELPSLSVA